MLSDQHMAFSALFSVSASLAWRFHQSLTFNEIDVGSLGNVSDTVINRIARGWEMVFSSMYQHNESKSNQTGPLALSSISRIRFVT